MTLGAGALALKRYLILTELDSLSLTQIVDGLKKESISPLTLDDAREESLGWCHPFTGESDFTFAKDHLYGTGLIFGLRKDSKKIPGTTFKLQLKLAYDALEVKSDGRSKSKDSGKKVKEAIRDRIKEELLSHSLPSVRLNEVVWQLELGEVWLLSTSAAVVGDFENHFLKTFGLPLIPKTPGVFGLGLETLAKITPAKLQPYIDLLPVEAFGSKGNTFSESATQLKQEKSRQSQELTDQDLF